MAERRATVGAGLLVALSLSAAILAMGYMAWHTVRHEFSGEHDGDWEQIEQILKEKKN